MQVFNEATKTVRNVYSICGWCGGQNIRVTSDAIVAEYGRLGMSVPDWFANILANGTRYSYEDFDKLSAAMNELYRVNPLVWREIGKVTA